MSDMTINTQRPPRPSPMRVLRQWLFRERALRGPAAIELDVVDRQVTREEREVQTCATEADRIEQRLQSVRANVAAALCDKRTPGIIDCDEAATLARDLIGTSLAAHQHKTHLEALT